MQVGLLLSVAEGAQAEVLDGLKSRSATGQSVASTVSLVKLGGPIEDWVVTVSSLCVARVSGSHVRLKLFKALLLVRRSL